MTSSAIKLQIDKTRLTENLSQSDSQAPGLFMHVHFPHSVPIVLLLSVVFFAFWRKDASNLLLLGKVVGIY